MIHPLATSTNSRPRKLYSVQSQIILRRQHLNVLHSCVTVSTRRAPVVENPFSVAMVLVPMDFCHDGCAAVAVGVLGHVSCVTNL